jgi:hypothetical protein
VRGKSESQDSPVCAWLILRLTFMLSWCLRVLLPREPHKQRGR